MGCVQPLGFEKEFKMDVVLSQCIRIRGGRQPKCVQPHFVFSFTKTMYTGCVWRKWMEKRTNEAWLADLRTPGSHQEAALADLRCVILEGLPYALAKWLSPLDPRFQPLAEEVAQDTLLRVMARLDSFEGRSQFTTWVHTISVRVALTELRRAKWQEVSLDDMLSGEEAGEAPNEFADPARGVEASAEKESILAMLQLMLQQDLTEKQRKAMIAVVIKGIPMEEVARRMGMERNTLYKLLHDARIKLKKRLEKEGLSPEEILSAFHSG
jgi:RNA polymerase sigma-70 factor, ECF subfamily